VTGDTTPEAGAIDRLIVQQYDPRRTVTIGGIGPRRWRR
jgi:hypothetical protein